MRLLFLFLPLWGRCRAATEGGFYATAQAEIFGKSAPYSVPKDMDDEPSVSPPSGFASDGA